MHKCDPAIQLKFAKLLSCEYRAISYVCNDLRTKHGAPNGREVGRKVSSNYFNLRLFVFEFWWIRIEQKTHPAVYMACFMGVIGGNDKVDIEVFSVWSKPSRSSASSTDMIFYKNQYINLRLETLYRIYYSSFERQRYTSERIAQRFRAMQANGKLEKC